MIKIVDTYYQINKLFDNGAFNYSKWEEYINSVYDNSAHIFRDEVEKYINSGKYTFEKDFLPVIDAVCENPKLNALHESFLTVTDNLDKRVTDCFGRELNIDIVLYLGLCNAAGWVTSINGTDAVLLGVEKIIDLGWHSADSMCGLIYHELGHVYHAQHGKFKQKSDDNKREFVWQLFTEGIAMYFEQAVVGDFNYYHQNINGWKEWCDKNFLRILTDFNRELPDMTRFNQRYFGDLCDYYGHSDVGYYLGARFVHYLVTKYQFDDLIGFDIDLVYSLYTAFLKQQTSL